MEKEYVDAKYSGNKFKTKYDLCIVLSFDCKYPCFNFKLAGFFLPFYKKCGVYLWRKYYQAIKI